MEVGVWRTCFWSDPLNWLWNRQSSETCGVTSYCAPCRPSGGAVPGTMEDRNFLQETALCPLFFSQRLKSFSPSRCRQGLIN